MLAIGFKVRLRDSVCQWLKLSIEGYQSTATQIKHNNCVIRYLDYSDKS